MSFRGSRTADNGRRPTNGAATPRPPHRRQPLAKPSDAAIDRRLRDVPLPDGLMTRLGKMVYNVCDEQADRVDWLGC